MKKIFIIIIKFYQRNISPMKSTKCPYYPCCSQYGLEAIQKYGAFVLINDKYDGLIHISEISSGYVKNVNDYIKIKDKIFAQVVDIDRENSKFKLSIKNIDYRNDGKVINTEENFSNGFEPLTNAV